MIYIEDMKEFIDKAAQLNRAVSCADYYLTTTVKNLGSLAAQDFRGFSSKCRKFVQYPSNRRAARRSGLTA